MAKSHLFIILAFALAFAVLLSGCVEHQGDRMAQDAIAKNDPSLCNTLKESRDKTECFVVYSTEKSDPSVCLQSTAPPEDCISEYTLKKRSMVPCDLLTDPAKKYTCVAKFTGDSTGRALETIIGDWKTSGLVSKCMAQCDREAVKCREKCISDKYSEAQACDKNDPQGEEYRRCVFNAGEKQRECIGECDDLLWYTCEPPCKALAEGK